MEYIGVITKHVTWLKWISQKVSKRQEVSKMFENGFFHLLIDGVWGYSTHGSFQLLIRKTGTINPAAVRPAFSQRKFPYTSQYLPFLRCFFSLSFEGPGTVEFSRWDWMSRIDHFATKIAEPPTMLSTKRWLT